MPKCFIFAVSVLAGLTACDGKPAFGPESPALNWTNNPDGGGLMVHRYQDHFALSWTDPRNGLRATHTTFPLGDCGPQQDLERIGFQEVGLEDAQDVVMSWLRLNAKGPLWVIVRVPDEPGTCFGNRLVAQGWGTIHLTDNDIFGVIPGDRNANAWGIGGTGTLTTPDARRLSYTGHARFTVTGLDEDDFPIFSHEQFFVNLR